MSKNKRAKKCNLEDSFGKTPIDPKSLDEEHIGEDLIQNDDGMPTLVVKIFIESITDVEVLKKIRFVNKYWNYEACVALRKLSFINLTLCDKSKQLNIGSKYLEDFLVVQKSGQSLSLPSPFKTASIFIHELSKYQDVFHDLFKSPDFEIKSLYINLYKYKNLLGPLNELLKSKEAEITELEFFGSNSLSDLREVLSEIKLSHLQALRMEDFYCHQIGDDCDHVEIIKRITMGSPLSSLTMYIEMSSCFSSFLSMDLTRITKLHLEVAFDMEKKHWDSLAALQLPSLKSLEFGGFGDLYITQVRSFYMNVSSTVENLKFSVDSDAFNALGTGVYPKSKSLTIEKMMTPLALNNITQEMFPHLKDVEVTIRNRDNLFSSEINPLERVQKLHATIFTRDGDSMQMSEDWPSKTDITALAKKFPNVKNLHIGCNGKWASSHFQNVYHAYPSLNSFSMLPEVSFEIFAGATKQALNSEWPAQNFPRMLSIVDFQCLESLHVHSYDVNISNETIQYCFARIPNLKHLSFPWKRELSLDVVRDFLQHLHTLEISNAYKCRNILADLQMVLPRTTLRKNTNVEKYL